MTTKKIVILGGGFGGVYAAKYLQKYTKKYKGAYEIVLVNRDNYFVYQPMLADIVGGSIDVLDTVSSLRKLLPQTTLHINDIDSIDTGKKTISLMPKFSHTLHTIHYDHLVVALGNVTDFRGLKGIHEHAMAFKNVADALSIRNKVIDAIEAAAACQNPNVRKKLLTFVVAGGGFSGTEIVAELNDFIRKLCKRYKTIPKEEIRVVLVHSKDRLMNRELSASLGDYAAKILRKRGVEILFNTRLVSASPDEAVLDTAPSIKTKTIISTVPSSPNPLLECIGTSMERSRLIVTSELHTKENPHIWAIGDCALIPLENGSYAPPTAQFAIREAKQCAKNIVSYIDGKEMHPFKFKALGMLGALGHHRAVAELFGCIKISGFLAWLMWRGIYLVKLPGFDRKCKVFISWILESIFPQEAVQLKIEPTQGVAPLHFEKDDVIFNEGDLGDYLYIITEGVVGVFKSKNGEEHQIATLQKGAYFGEMALINDKTRSATVKAMGPTDVLALKKSDFGMLVSNFKDLKNHFEKTTSQRTHSKK